MRLIRDDVDRIRAICDSTGRALTDEEGLRLARYVTSLRTVVRDRQIDGRRRFANKTMEELLEMAKEIPELRDALQDDE